MCRPLGWLASIANPVADATGRDVSPSGLENVSPSGLENVSPSGLENSRKVSVGHSKWLEVAVQKGYCCALSNSSAL